ISTSPFRHSVASSAASHAALTPSRETTPSAPAPSRRFPQRRSTSTGTQPPAAILSSASPPPDPSLATYFHCNQPSGSILRASSPARLVAMFVREKSSAVYSLTVPPHGQSLPHALRRSRCSRAPPAPRSSATATHAQRPCTRHD